VVEVPMRRKLHSLQALRALAALLVVADHAIYYLAEKQDVAQSLQNLAWFLGTFGVDIFFVISGFIMIYTARDLFGTRLGFAKFAYRRIIRIVPLYWLATIIAAGLLVRHQFPSNFEIFTSLAFIPVVAQAGEPLRPILGVGWTLNLEMFFYALFTVSLLFSRRTGTILVVSLLVLLVAVGGLLKPVVDTNDPLTVATFLTNPILLLFAAGVVLGTMIDLSDRWAFRVPLGAIIVIGLIVAAVALFVVCVDQAPWPFGWQVVFWGLCVAIVLLAIVAEEHRSGALAGLERLGDASYSIYLFHFLVIAAVGRVWLTMFGHIALWPFAAVAFVTASAVGLAIHLWVERPMLVTLRHLRPVLTRMLAPAKG
jgi:exopolysaccharide production protein ExoZ